MNYEQKILNVAKKHNVNHSHLKLVVYQTLSGTTGTESGKFWYTNGQNDLSIDLCNPFYGNNIRYIPCDRIKKVEIYHNNILIETV